MNAGVLHLRHGNAVDGCARLLMLWLWLAGGLLGGCQITTPAPQRPTDQTTVERALSEGYSLLHNLLDQQGGVDRLLLFKATSQPTRELIRQIARTSRESQQLLGAWLSEDGRLTLDSDGLPYIEQAARVSMEQGSARALLTSGGDDFELRLLLTQISATEYAAVLARQLAVLDEHPIRPKQLREMADRFDALNQQAVARLTLRPMEVAGQ